MPLTPRFSADALLSAVYSWKDFQEAANCLTEKQKGDLFERLVQLFLEIQPEYRLQLKEVWLYADIPFELKLALNLSKEDRGIDLLAKTFDGEFWGVQAKYRTDVAGSISLSELGTFGTQVAAITRGLVRGIICATKREKTPDFAHAASFKFQHVLLDTWETLGPEFWTVVRQAAAGRSVDPLVPSKPRPYQLAAIDAARSHFLDNDGRRGKLIMPCGTGKSLIGYWTAIRSLEAKTILVAVPSLDLIRQTLAVWAREAIASELALEVLVICSDQSTSVGDAQIDELAAPVTTDPARIQAWLGSPARPTGQRVVFVTYQSGKVLADAAGSFQFDAALFDEAHKTAGFEHKRNQHLLYDKNLSARHRVFMTATERYYDGESDEVVGMNDASIYGERYHYMPFAEAIDQGILADYSVVLFTVTRTEAEEFRKLIENRIYVQTCLGEEGETDRLTAEDLATAVALRKALAKYNLCHAVSFHSRNRYAKNFVEIQQALNKSGLFQALSTFRVSSKLSTGRRHSQLKGFEESECGLISNSRCLTEGVDVPGIDLVLFAQPRKSKVDIVQAVGRALRKPTDQPGKRGYVLVPLLVEEDTQLDVEEIVKGTGFENLVSVLKAMATVDEDVNEKISVVVGREPHQGRARGERGGGEQEIVPEKVDLEQFSEALRLRAWDRLAGLRKPHLSEEQILAWADAHNKRTDKWPNVSTGPVADAPTENWLNIETSLFQGRRGLPGGSSLAKLLESERGVRNKGNLQSLSEEQILAWAKAHKDRTGEWPKRTSGRIPDTEHETWSTVNKALINGTRGLPIGSSLPRLLEEKLGVQNHLTRPDLTEDQILVWADAYRQRNNGALPTAKSGDIPEAVDESWRICEGALLKGLRGLPGNSSLAKLFAKERGHRNEKDLPPLTEEQILAWAESHFHRTGKWPVVKSGLIPETLGEKWQNIDAVLSSGLRGLPGDSSLAKLLGRGRGVRNPKDLPPLTVEQILAWAESHFHRTGKWPVVKSGCVHDAQGERWNAIDHSLRNGRRGLAGGSSLAQLLEKQHGVVNPKDRPALTEDRILEWADVHFRRTGKWPTRSSGDIPESTGDTWQIIQGALSKGRRGLPGNSSLSQLLENEKGVRNIQNPPQLSEDQILQWADSYRNEIGKWPTRSSGDIPESTGETWSAVDSALKVGRRGLPGGSSLAKLLENKRPG